MSVAEAQRLSRETVFHAISGSTISTQDLHKQRVTADSTDLIAGCCFTLTFDLQIQSYLPYPHLSRKLPRDGIVTGITRLIDETGIWLVRMITVRRLQVDRPLVANEGL